MGVMVVFLHKKNNIFESDTSFRARYGSPKAQWMVFLVFGNGMIDNKSALLSGLYTLYSILHPILKSLLIKYI